VLSWWLEKSPEKEMSYKMQFSDKTIQLHEDNEDAILYYEPGIQRRIFDADQLLSSLS